MAKSLTVLVLLIFLFGAWSKIISTKERRPGQTIEQKQQAEMNLAKSMIRSSTFFVKDGLECIVIYDNGISCNWPAFNTGRGVKQ